MSRNLFGQLNNLFGSGAGHPKASSSTSSWECVTQPRTRFVAKLLGLHQARVALSKQTDRTFGASLLPPLQHPDMGAADVTLARSDLLHALHLCFADAGAAQEVPSDGLWWGLVRDVVRELLLLSQAEWRSGVSARQGQPDAAGGSTPAPHGAKKDSLALVSMAVDVIRWAVADLFLVHLKLHKSVASAPPLHSDQLNGLVTQVAELLATDGAPLPVPIVISLLGASFALSDSNSHNILSCIVQGAAADRGSSTASSSHSRSHENPGASAIPHHTASHATSQLYSAVEIISQQVRSFVLDPLRSYLTLKTAEIVAAGSQSDASSAAPPGPQCSVDTLLSLECCVLLLNDDESTAPSSDFERLSREVEKDAAKGPLEQRSSPASASSAEVVLNTDLHYLCALLRLRVLQRHVRHEVRFGDTAVAVPIAMEAQLLAHQINAESGTSAMLTLVKALMANGSSNDAVVVAAQLVQLAKLRWSCSSRNVANAMLLVKALEVHSAALIEHQEWDKALLEVFQGIAHLSATERMLHVGGTSSRMIFFVSEQLNAFRVRGHFLSHAWKCFLKLKHRVASAQYFYQHVSHLRSVQGVAANFTLCDAYFDRAELLVELQMDEEAVSMYAAAREALTTSSPGDQNSNNWRFVEIERNMALSYIKIAEREGNRTAKRLTLHLATSMAYSSLSRANKLGLTLQIRKSTVAVASALYSVGQLRKAAVLLEPIVETRHLPPTDPQEVSDGTDSTNYDALLLLAKCLTLTEPQRALDVITVFRSEISAQIDQLKQRRSKSIVGLTAFKRRKFMAMLQKRLLQEVRESAEAAVVSGDAYLQLKMWDQALSEYSSAMGLFTQIEEHKQEAQMYGRLSRVYRALGQVNTATEYLRHMMSMASEQRDELLRYEATILLTKLYLETNKAAEATQLYRSVTSLAHQFEDDEVERITTKNLITAQKSAGLFADLVITAQALEKMSSDSKNTVDRRFALEHAADALFHLGQYKKCLELIDECEKIPDHGGQGIGNVTGAMHSTRAKALLAMRNGSAAIDVLEEWRTRAANAESWLEVAKACVHLGNAFAAMSPLDAKKAFFASLDACTKLDAQSDESRAAALDAVKWIVHHYYLNEDLVATNAPAPSATQGAETEMAQDIGTPSTSSGAAAGTTKPLSANPLDDDPEDGETEERAEYDGGDDDDGEDEEGTFAMVRQATDQIEEEEEEDPLPSTSARNHAAYVLTGAIESDKASAELMTIYSPTTAIEVIEFFTRLICGFYDKWASKPLRSPRTTVELALSAFPNSTFIFYVEEFSSPSSSTFDVIFRPGGTCFVETISGVSTVHLKDYHNRRTQQTSSSGSSSSSSSSDRVKRSDDDPIDDLFVNLRSLHDSLWEPVSKALHDVSSKLHLVPRAHDPVIVVPDAGLMNIPFPALVSQQRKTVMQRSCVVVSPSLEHLLHFGTMNFSDQTFVSDPYAENTIILPELKPVAKAGTASSQSGGGGPTSLRRSMSLASDSLRHWNQLVGCTRKELAAAFSNVRSRSCWILCDVSDGGFRCVDGTVTISELVQSCPGGVIPPSVELLILTNDRSVRPSVHDLGPAAVLCLQHGCKRVLRVDVAQGTSITHQHQQMLKMFLDVLQVALEQGLRSPYAVALQAVQADAVKMHMPPHVWGALTLVGIP